ncbi:hypothetical protein LTR66_010886, partial [Elasticomyces elasticus]
MATRRSNRQRQLPKKYTIDAFEGLDIERSPDLDDRVPIKIDDEGRDAEFNEAAVPTPDTEEDDYVFMDGANDEEVESEDGESVGEEANDDDSIIGSEIDTISGVIATKVSDHNMPPKGSAARRERNRTAPVAGRKRVVGDLHGDQGKLLIEVDKPYNRGMLDIHNHCAKETRVLYTFGPTPEDILPIKKARTKWGNEPTLPSHKEHQGRGGLGYSFSQSEEMRTKEAVEGWGWYYRKGGKQAFSQRQKSEVISADQAARYMPDRKSTRSFIMGPSRAQKLYDLPVGLPIHTGSAFDDKAATNGNTEPPKTSVPQRNGWMMNVGDNVHCLDWAPNQSGSRQYLALSTLPLPRYPSDHKLYEAPEAPAFSSQPGHPASIQIWEFPADERNIVNSNQSPKLRQVICTDWGDIRLFKWCPMQRSAPAPAGDHDTRSLGLLAGLWSDGAVRVIDVNISISSASPVYHHATATAFT